MQIKIYKKGNYCKILTEIPFELKQKLISKFSYEKPNAMWIRRNSNWDGIVRLYTKNNTFLTGFLYDVIKEIVRHYVDSGIKPSFLILNSVQKLSNIEIKEFNAKLRDYQQEAVESFLKKKYGVIKLQTGMGKTIIAGAIISQVKLKTLWIIDRKILVEQTRKVFKDLFACEIGSIMEGKINLKDITVATYQSIMSNIDKLKDYLSEVGLLVVDEVHKASCKSIKKICRLAYNTHYRLGLSATPDLKPEWMEIKGLIGDICYSMSPDDERLDKFLSKAKIYFLEFDDLEYSIKGDYKEVYDAYIVHNPKRNLEIIKLVQKYKDKNILIITKTIEHAKKLSELLNCSVLIGETTKDERERIINNYNSDKPFVCVGSYAIISEGLDIPNLDIVIQASGLSSPIKTIQGLGRVMRRKENKEPLYFDFADKWNTYMHKASLLRQRALKMEGYNVKVVKNE